MNNKYRYYGVNDDESVCSHCGKTGLKRVVWLAVLDEEGNEVSEPAPYGTTCAAEMLGWRYGTRKQTESRFNEMLNTAIVKEGSERLTNLIKEGVFVIYCGKYIMPVGEICRKLVHREIEIKEAIQLRNAQYPHLFDVNLATLDNTQKTEILRRIRE